MTLKRHPNLDAAIGLKKSGGKECVTVISMGKKVPILVCVCVCVCALENNLSDIKLTNI